jgi:flavin reductase (DIM6/NTAB) family NADH-FMN oxidoreductase RutF
VITVHALTEGIDCARFRSAMGAFATGVTVVAVRDRDGGMYGMTVNSFASVSLDPPLVLVCLADAGRGQELVRAAGVFSVNVLAESQRDLSRWFADRRRPTDTSMFDGVPLTTGVTGCPLLDEAAATFDCRVHRIVPAGDHVIVLGEVLALTHDPASAPLVFHGGGYGSLTAEGRTQLRAV